MEDDTPIINDPKKVLNTLEALRRENDEYKKIISKYKDVDLTEFEQLKQRMAQYEEEKLRSQENWAELTSRETAKYQKLIDELTDNLNRTQEEKLNLDSALSETKRRQAALDQYLAKGGKREYFNNVWKAELSERTQIVEDKLVVEDKPISDWLENYRSNGGGIFFEPTINSSGLGISPATNNGIPSTSNQPLIITRAQAGDRKFMSGLKTKISKDPLQAISDGTVVVQD
jgi:hypothetical protein